MKKHRQISKGLNNFPKHLRNIVEKMQTLKIHPKVIFFFLGIASTIWFLVRVIPKPSRAGYPCMKAAAPFMSSFVLYLLTLAGSTLLLKRARNFFFKTRYISAAGLVLAGIAGFAISTNMIKLDTQASVVSVNNDFISNLPYGEGVGVFPGRVVWAWNQDATNENTTNGQGDEFFKPENNDQSVVQQMMNSSLLKLTGAVNLDNAWDSIFIYFNNKKHGLKNDYTEGEMIFIKLNEGTSSWLADDETLERDYSGWRANNPAVTETTPVTTYALLDNLVNHAGVPQENIMVADPQSHVWQHTYEYLSAAFPNVKYGDKGDYDHLGRTQISPSNQNIMKFSDKGTVMESGIHDNYYLEMEQADYIINIACLKAHARAGITLTAKNHFGSQNRGGATHMHPGLIAPENDEIDTQNDRDKYNQYRVQVDLMGHERIGLNTLLFLVDGLWGGPEATDPPVKWKSAPFNNDWPNSLFVSLDQVALESVCLDFLRTEFDDPNGPAKARPNFPAVDDYLHQAADPGNWPADISYDPEGDGTPIGSLGVHEHWNNSSDKQYSRNLGYDYGIELVSTNSSLVESAVIAHETVSVPVIDGIADDACWESAQWTGINETWIPWGASVDSSDYYGRFKMTWSEEENLVYYLVEITDDVFVDGYVYPNDGYPNYDIVEIFIDEDKSGGLHVFDDNANWGQNSENAFSHHIAVEGPADGQTSSTFVVADIDGTDWGDKTIPNYANHFPELTMKKEGNKYIYEFSMAIYDDTYDHNSPEISRVTLTPDKLMGMSVAYCDNDDPNESPLERDNFFGSVWVPEEAYNDHWKDASGYGSLRLLSEGVVMNQPVLTSGEIDDYELAEIQTAYEVVSDVASLFMDPDGDTLSFNVDYDEIVLLVVMENNTLTVEALSEFSGTKAILITASDGETEATQEILVSLPAPNQPVQATGTVSDYEIVELNTGYTVLTDVSGLFSDPDGDVLSYSLTFDNSHLQANITDKQLTIEAIAEFEGSEPVKITATDGEFEASVTFNVSLLLTGIDRINNIDYTITCYPNPFYDVIKVQFEKMGSVTELNVTIFDLAGKLIINETHPVTNANKELSFNLNHVSTGVYMLRIKDNHGRNSMILLNRK